MSSLGSPSTFFLAKKKAYEVERSLRFNDGDSAYLNRTPSGAGNRKTFTLSAWVKRGSEFTDEEPILAADTTSAIRFSSEGGSDSKINVYYYSGGWVYRVHTNAELRDPSAWYHLVIAFDTTQATASNRIKIYQNGVQLTDMGNSDYPSQNYDTAFNNTVLHTIGRNGTSGDYFDGYMAEYNFIDGLALDPSYFGKTDPLTGQWNPKKYTGSYGTNGFYLNFSDNSGTTATTLGKDYSGNGNNWTPNNFSVAAGKDDDSSFDSPTNNFPTLSPVDRSLVGTMSNGNLRVSYNYKPASKSWRSTMALPSTGKIYWEWENEEASSNPGRWQTGLVRYTDEAGVVDFQGYNDVNYVSISFGGSTWNGTTHMSSWPSFSFYSGERAAIAIDCSNGKLWVGKVASNGSTTWYANDGGTDGDPAGGTNESFTIPNFTTATEWMPHIVWHDGGGASSTTFTSNINFGNHSFLGTVPTGFGKLCSANLPDPSIKLPNKHFDTLLWTGDGATSKAITGLSFTPDFVWTKRRSGADNHHAFDSVRGASSARLFPNLTNAEDGNFNSINSFDSNGFTVGNNVATNANGETFVAWNWKGGGSASSNSDGTITSSVSVNASAGFSIVSYTGTGSDGTIGHGLGVAPSIYIVKRRNSAKDWYVQIGNLSGIDLGRFLKLNTTDSINFASDVFAATADTSTVLNTKSDSATNASGDTYVAYVFSEVAGFSKFGSYEGNQNADGPFVYLGFTPAWIMIKNADNASNRQWCIIDATRTTFNKSASAEVLFANDSQSESVANNNYGQFASKAAVDIVSNGFKVREGETSAYTQTNRPNSHIYLAFAESPFKYARAK